MAYESKNLSVLAYSNGFTLWHYASTDTAATLDTAGYFNEAGDMLRTGDMIMANVETATAPKAGIFLVASSQANAVDLADMTALSSLNSD